tara:strand:- start:457 stop:1008 length:552 start_codon:yes stop_codon:yes gene_type:complete
MKTSKKEIVDLVKAWAAITIAFGIVLRGELGIYISLLVSAFSVGLGFLLHELAHKLVAQRYRYFAEFRSFDQMLFLAIAMSFFGFVFAAPGAVMIHGLHISKERNGKISIAGPIVNVILAVIFFLLQPILGVIAFYGTFINLWLALFNMIPFWNFDGSKIWRWNKGIWMGFTALVLILFILSN